MAIETISWLRAEPRAATPRLLTLPLAPALALVDAAALAIPLLLFADLGILGAAYAVLAMLSLAAVGMYRIRISPSVAQEVPRIVGTLAVPLVVVSAFSSSSTGVSEAAFGRLGMLTFASVVLGRALAYAGLRSSRSKGLVLEPVVIVGAGRLGAQLADTLLEHAEYGLLPVGFVDSFNDEHLPLPVLGDASALRRIIHEHEISRVIVAFGGTREPEMVQVLRACDEANVDIYVLPRFFELGVAPQGADADDVWGIPLMRLSRQALRSPAWRVKRAFDLVVASVALLLVAPLLLVLAGLVKVSSPGPVFFRQRRIGQKGLEVDILKFRSMRANDESDLQWTVRNDDRVTWIGKIMRRTSLDELPQLINIVKGDMSLVGPRPERPFFVDQFGEQVPRYGDRHRVPVGLTGWAQVHGLRGDTSIEDRARFDNQYIEHWSLWKDVSILLRTAREVARGGGE